MFIYPFQILFPQSLLRLPTSFPVIANWNQQAAAKLGLIQCPLNFWLLLEQKCWLDKWDLSRLFRNSNWFLNSNMRKTVHRLSDEVSMPVACNRLFRVHLKFFLLIPLIPLVKIKSFHLRTALFFSPNYVSFALPVQQLHRLVMKDTRRMLGTPLVWHLSIQLSAK